MSKQLASHVRWRTLPASSRSLLIARPYGLPKDTNCDVMSAGKCAHHMMGCTTAASGDVPVALGYCWGVQGTAVSPGSTAPLYIEPDASWYPSSVGWNGTIAYSLVGRLLRSSASHRNSARVWWMPLVSDTLFLPHDVGHLIWSSPRRPLLYTWYHLSELQNCTWILSTNVLFYFHI